MSKIAYITTNGVLGDHIEAAGITLIETSPESKIIHIISISEPDVNEGIYPTWVDMNNDGEREIIVTLSNARNGARIVTFREDGSLLAEGPTIGMGYLWRHQLVVTPFGETGENLLAVVRTPHIRGAVEFYRLCGDKLEIMSSIPGISTHSIGSRNLFTAQGSDFNNDGQIELLVPDQSHTHLAVISMHNEATTNLDLEGELVSILGAAQSPDSNQVFLAGGLSKINS